MLVCGMLPDQACRMLFPRGPNHGRSLPTTGLSYTSFVLSKFSASPNRTTVDGSFTLSLVATNTGSTDGAVPIQVYFRDRCATLFASHRSSWSDSARFFSRPKSRRRSRLSSTPRTYATGTTDETAIPQPGLKEVGWCPLHRMRVFILPLILTVSFDKETH